MLDGGGPGILGIAVGEVVCKGAPSGGEGGTGAGGADGGCGSVVGDGVALAVGSNYCDGGSSSGTWIDEGLGKGPVVGAIGIGERCRLEIEGLGSAIG